MHAGQDSDLLIDLPMVPPPAGVSSEPHPTVRSVPLGPARLMPLHVPATARRVSADLHFPGDLVHARASEYAQEARVAGAQHTLRLWRESCREALIALARVATAVPTDAVCESLAWKMDGEDYFVSATFAQPAAPIVH